MLSIPDVFSCFSLPWKWIPRSRASWSYQGMWIDYEPTFSLILLLSFLKINVAFCFVLFCFALFLPDNMIGSNFTNNSQINSTYQPHDMITSTTFCSKDKNPFFLANFAGFLLVHTEVSWVLQHFQNCPWLGCLPSSSDFFHFPWHFLCNWHNYKIPTCLPLCLSPVLAPARLLFSWSCL